MTGQSTPIQARYTVRQETEPNAAGPPWTWINPAGGQSGNNSETYIYNDDTGNWELARSSGPDTPLRPAVGATWRDTSNGVFKNNADGTDAGWEPAGVTDHANLTNVNSNQHHAPPSSTQNNGMGGGYVPYRSGFSADQSGTVVPIGDVLTSMRCSAGDYDTDFTAVRANNTNVTFQVNSGNTSTKNFGSDMVTYIEATSTASADSSGTSVEGEAVAIRPHSHNI